MHAIAELCSVERCAACYNRTIESAANNGMES